MFGVFGSLKWLFVNFVGNTIIDKNHYLCPK